MSKPKVLICPYCGETQSAGERCRACGGLFEPLSRQATHNAMGPWFVRDEARPYQPGCSYETIIKLVERGTLNKYSIIRSPTTKQFWTVAKRVPGVAHLLGYCHNCDASVDAADHGCHACGVPFGAYLDRNFLGLPEIRPLPWEAPVEEEQRPAEVSPQRFDFRRAAEPMGISSFASDEELRAGGLEPVTRYQPPGATPQPFGGGGAGVAAGVPSQGQYSQSVATLTSDPAPLPSPRGVEPAPVVQAAPSLTATLMDTSPAGVAARAMQRRLERQRKTIQTLTITTFILAAAAVIAVAVILARSGGPAAGTAPATQPQESKPKASPQPVAQPSVKPDVTTHPPATMPAAESSATKSPAPGELESAFAAAQSLLTEARNSESAVPDRIARYEEALNALKALAKAATWPSATRPPDLDATISQAEQELERLKLKEFFP